MKLKIDNLKKSFGSAEILKGVSLEVGAGDVVALIGSSGSGKSTLLRCINLLEQANSGTLYLDDFEVTFEKKASIQNSKIEYVIRKKVGMVFQQFHLWPHLTVLQNLIKAPLCVLKRNKSEVIEEAKQLLNKVGLLDKQDRYPAQLSGGQQQRVAIARTLMMSPEIILFDEPTSALDPVMTKEVLKIINKLADEGMTMIIATHEIGFAREVASYAVFLDHGEIVEQGMAKDILGKPKTKRLQSFLQHVFDGKHNENIFEKVVE
ncbi:MAG: amino acid ABC transporter ATP-binding protein [Burkholderiales bacterium]|nr:amino acid ABC transporter ATP-binding protein [Burkholderiales bacterium]